MSQARFLLAALAFVALLPHSASAPAASAQPIGLEPEQRAKLARVRAKGSSLSKQFAANKRQDGQDGDECSIDIGNVDTNGRGRGPREVTIFIPGGVFQQDNRCR
jgi:hypothetical protein